MRDHGGSVPVWARVLQNDRWPVPVVAAIVAAVEVTAQRRHAMVPGGGLREAAHERRDPLVEQHLVVELPVGHVAVSHHRLPGLWLDHDPVIGDVAASAVVDGHRAVLHGGSELVPLGVQAVQPERHEPVPQAERSGDVSHFRDHSVDGPFLGDSHGEQWSVSPWTRNRTTETSCATRWFWLYGRARRWVGGDGERTSCSDRRNVPRFDCTDVHSWRRHVWTTTIRVVRGTPSNSHWNRSQPPQRLFRVWCSSRNSSPDVRDYRTFN